MADRYDIYGVVKVSSLDDEWVNYRDYAKLDDLCGRMATLLDDLTIKITGMDERTARELISEAEALR